MADHNPSIALLESLHVTGFHSAPLPSFLPTETEAAALLNFFLSPDTIKANCIHSVSGLRGWSRSGSENFSALLTTAQRTATVQSQTQLNDAMEKFRIGEPEVTGKMANVFPEGESSGFRETLETLYSNVHEHALAFLDWSHLPATFLRDRIGHGILTLNYYPPTPASLDTVLLHAHVDIDFLTFLFPLAASSTALQIKPGAGPWVTMDSDVAVVNAGEALADWKSVHGGRDIKSTVHRVVRVKTPEPGDQGRLTAAYFLPLTGEATLDDPVTGEKGENASKWRSKRVRKALKEAAKR